MNIKAIKNDSTYRRIAQLTVPIVLQNLLTAAVNSTDAVMLNFVGQAHISAVSLAAQYASILFNILYGLGTGISMLGAQYYGKGDLKTVESVAQNSLVLSLFRHALALPSASYHRWFILHPHSFVFSRMF